MLVCKYWSYRKGIYCSVSRECSNNYNISFENGKLTINKKDLTISNITANNKTYNPLHQYYHALFKICPHYCGNFCGNCDFTTVTVPMCNMENALLKMLRT